MLVLFFNRWFRWRNANRSTSCLTAFIVASTVGIRSTSILTDRGVDQPGTFPLLRRWPTDGDKRTAIVIIALQIYHAFGSRRAALVGAGFNARAPFAVVAWIV